jgi:uncharacterized cupin superfamily protein
VHEREDELFYVLEGERVFRIGDEERRAGPDAVVFGPGRAQATSAPPAPAARRGA